MKTAIEKAIYYSDVNTFNPIVTFEYTDETNFQEIINNLHQNIEVVAIFGNKDNICYRIFKSLNYKELLFDKTTSIYLVNRKGLAIRLCRSDDLAEKERIGVVKIDSVLAEYSPRCLKHYILYPIVFASGSALTYMFFKN